MRKQKKKIIRLSNEQNQVIESLIYGKSRDEAARDAGIENEAIDQWFETDSSFVASLNQRQQSNHAEHIRQLRSMTDDALGALENLLKSENESVKLRAAALVLKTVGLEELKAPSGSATVEAVEADWKREDLFSSLASF